MIGQQACAVAGIGGPRSGVGVPRPAQCLVVVGSRREAIALFPVVHALDASHYLDPVVVVASNGSRRHEAVLRQAGISADADVRCDRSGRSVNHVIAGVVSRFDDLLARMNAATGAGGTRGALGGELASAPTVALIFGASTVALGAALATTGAGVPVVHLPDRDGAAGSGTADFNGRLVARLASFHMAATSAARTQLVAEGVTADRVFVTGDTRVDAFRWAADAEMPWPDHRLAEVDDPRRKVVVADLGHRVPPQTAHRTAAVLGEIAALRPDVVTVLIASPDPQQRAALLPPLTGLANVIAVEPLPYATFAHLVARADLAVTDSPTLQHEAPAVGTPVLVAGGGCRAQAAEAGCARALPDDPVASADDVIGLLDGTPSYERMRRSPNPFGDGAAASRVTAALEHLIFDTPPPAAFRCGPARPYVPAAAAPSDTDARVAASLTRVAAAPVPAGRSRGCGSS